MPRRFYSPDFARWLSPDPLGGNVMNPQSLNRYAYALNNPATFNDPLGLQGFNPANQCSDLAYAARNAECGTPLGELYAIWQWACMNDSVCSMLVGSSSATSPGTQGNSAPPSAPPAGQPGLTGNSFIHDYPCLSPEQFRQLVSILVNVGGNALGTALSGRAGQGPKIGGAQNISTNATGDNPIYVDPSVLARSQPADPLEQLRGWHRQIIVPDTHLPGPGSVVHILFNTSKVNSLGLPITRLEIHADIAGQQDLVSLVHHGWSDVFLSPWSSSRQGGCAVKFF